MKRTTPVVLALLATLSVADEMRRLKAAETRSGPARVNPSRTTTPANPSRTLSPINPSGTIPPANPSGSISPIAPSRTISPSSPEAAPAPPAPAPSAPPVTVQVFVAVTRGPNELQGLPSMGNAGIPVDGLRVETDRGRVVLNGFVRSESDKAEAGMRAAAVAGEGKVINRLVVRP